MSVALPVDEEDCNQIAFCRSFFFFSFNLNVVANSFFFFFTRFFFSSSVLFPTALDKSFGCAKEGS